MSDNPNQPNTDIARAIVDQWQAEGIGHDYARLGDIIAEYAPLDAPNVMYLIGAVQSQTSFATGIDTAKFILKDGSKIAAANASKKGETWRRIAIAQYNSPDFTEPGTSIPKFAETIAGEILKDEHGSERAPGYRQVCDVLRAARGNGELKD